MDQAQQALEKADAAGEAVLHEIDARFSLKRLHRKLQLLARALIVGTFVDDAIRITFDYTGQKDSMVTVGFPPSVSYVLPVLFIAIQVSGVGCVLFGKSTTPQIGCLILGIWCAVHPFLYLQHHNLEFVLESLTIIGGLLILTSSERLSLDTAGGTKSASADEEQTDVLHLVGRVCTCAVFVYYVVKMMDERIKKLLGRSPDEELMTAAVEAALLVALFITTGLIVVGMRSRWCAGVLALIVSVAALYKHPWFFSLWSTKMYTLDFVVGYEGTEVPGWLYSDHQRYFFFQQLSTAGALLLLVVHGPGRYSIDEPLGPVQIVTNKAAD